MTFNVRPANGRDGRRYIRWRHWLGSHCRATTSDEEFDSPETIPALAAALAELGHEVELLGYGEPMLRRLLDGPRPDLVWNIAEGHGGRAHREARVPAVLEMLDIPYTGSDPLTLAATLDKDCAKRLVADRGVATPAWVLFDGDWSSPTPATGRTAISGVRQAGFRRFEQGNSWPAA